MVDVNEQIDAVTRELRTEELDGEPSRIQIIAQEYPADLADVWAATTEPERIARWFLPVSGTLDILMQTFTIMGQNLARYELRDADVVIRPQLRNVGATDFLSRYDTILEGEKAAQAALPQIREALRKAAAG